jgi:hypothetical protein
LTARANYWSDYIDLDLYSGPAQNQPGSDGIWDHARVLDAQNADNYPLAYRWQSTRWTLFSDGFESGTFSKWSGTSTTSGETIQVQSGRIYAGRYSARFTSNGGG